MSYDPDNIFAKILRGDIPSQPIYEDEFALAIPDIAPKAPIHILVITKGPYIDMNDFTARASEREREGFFSSIPIIAKVAGLENGYRMISNIGPDSGQEVPHLHIHLLGGGALGPLTS